MCTDENETLAYISNDLRDWADKLPEDEGGAWFERPVEQMQEILRDIADKIDAAWKRERDDAMKTAMMAKCEVCSEQPLGNAAAMREALVGLSQSAQDFMATKGRNFYPDLAVALEAAAAALAAPPRNCDRFATVKDAAIAFSKLRNNPHPCPDFTFSAWLMSATEEGAERRIQ